MKLPRWQRRPRIPKTGLLIHDIRKKTESNIDYTSMKASEKKSPNESHAVPIPIDGTLDLHHFRPQEVADLVSEYLKACKGKGILQVRLIHGKGIGALRETVHATLRKNSDCRKLQVSRYIGRWLGSYLGHLKVKYWSEPIWHSPQRYPHAM